MAVGTALKIFLLLTVINVVLVYGLEITGIGYTLSEGQDIFDITGSGKDVTTKKVGQGLSSDLTTLEEEAGVIKGDTGVTFLDAIKIPFKFLKAIFRVYAVPITLMTSQEIPPLIGWLIGFPLALGYMFAIMALIRGVAQ